MVVRNTEASDTAGQEIVLTRLFDAPRELVWEAYTNPKHLVQWFGPHGFRNTFLEIDARPGGVWRFIMHAPDGTDYDNRIVFLEVVKPERLVYDHGSDIDDDPERFRATVTFTEEGAGTRVTSRAVFATAEQRERDIGFGAIELGNQTMERLAEHLATM